MLTDLETARNMLTNTQPKDTLDAQSKEVDVLESEYDNRIEDGVSEFDDFILVPTKRNRKLVARLSLSGRKPLRSLSRKTPCLRTKRNKK